MANKTVGNGVGPVHSNNNANHQNQFVQQPVLLRTGKVNITPARPQSVPIGRQNGLIPVLTGRQNRPILVPTGRQNRPIPVPTSRGYTPSVTFGLWQSTARPMPHLNRPTSSYFQTYRPYVPQMYYNHKQYGGVRWVTAVKLSAGCSWKTHRKGLYWENSYTDAEDEGIFDSGCSRSMTGKYVPVCKKNKPNVYSHVQVTGYVLGLPNVTTWEEIEKKMGARKSKTCADKAKGKRKVSCGS
ncbi:hypothetical protein Tco_0050682 [Tanacetum coccineum]